MAANPNPNDGGTPGGANNWFAALPPEQSGFLQNKGFADPDPAVTATKLLAAYQGVEKFVGAPPDRVLLRPVDGDAPGNKAFWQQLGAPERPEDYTFEGISFGDDESDKALTAKFTDKLRTTATSVNAPKAVVDALARAAFDFIDDYGQERLTEVEAQKVADKQALEKDWGTPDTDRFKANMLIANRAAERIGAELSLSQDDIQKFRDAIGSSPVTAKIFNFFGRSLGEASYVADPNNGRDIMTREQAIAERFRLTGIDSRGGTTGRADPEFSKKVLSKTEGANERRRLADLNRIIVGAA